MSSHRIDPLEPDTQDSGKELVELEGTITALIANMQKHRKRIDCFYYEDEASDPDFKESTNYYSEFWKTFLINQFMVTQLKDLSKNVSSLESDVALLETLEEQYAELYKQKNKRKNRRLASEISKGFSCPYNNCYKVYGTDVSLNLHMKIKHNGGNKTERESLARQYVRAMKMDLPLPQLSLSFPPNYLDPFMEEFEKTQSSHP